jgi:hypothetical protein
MAFDTLSDRLKIVANGSLTKCRGEWGGNGLRMEAPIATPIGWLPTFYLKPSRVLIIAVEANDVIFPEMLKIAAHDIEHYDFPIAIYQACSLDVYQNDSRLARVNLLRDHGFGLITVDDEATAMIQIRAEPLAQHITPERFDSGIRALTPRLKVKFRGAYSTYKTNIVQGLQEAAQIVEAVIICIAGQAAATGIVSKSTSKKATAKIIDVLYNTTAFANHRAALGGARSFVREYRNPPSHPARTPKEAAERIRKCKAGFFEALRVAAELRSVIHNLGYRVVIH